MKTLGPEHAKAAASPEGKAALEAYLAVALTFSNAMKTFDGTPASALGVSVAAMEYAQAYVALEGGFAKIAGEMQ